MDRIIASYQHVVVFEEMLEELCDRHPDIDPEVVAQIAADTWFHIFSYFPKDASPQSESGSWGLCDPTATGLNVLLGGPAVSSVLRPTSGDHLDVKLWDDE